MPLLFLVPTEFERNLVSDLLDEGPFEQGRVAISGWGLVQAGIRTLKFLEELRPSQVWVIGIAGSYSEKLRIGEAYEFTQIVSYGIGVGCGELYQHPVDLGWPVEPNYPEIIEVSGATSDQQRRLLSVCAASTNDEEVRWKLSRYPNALAEDMETYSIAAACRACQVPLRVVRGISNRAGDRDKTRWNATAAMRAAVRLVRERSEGL
jgi:futalosine hydrolase